MKIGLVVGFGRDAVFFRIWNTDMSFLLWWKLVVIRVEYFYGIWKGLGRGDWIDMVGLYRKACTSRKWQTWKWGWGLGMRNLQWRNVYLVRQFSRTQFSSHELITWLTILWKLTPILMTGGHCINSTKLRG